MRMGAPSIGAKSLTCCGGVEAGSSIYPLEQEKHSPKYHNHFVYDDYQNNNSSQPQSTNVTVNPRDEFDMLWSQTVDEKFHFDSLNNNGVILTNISNSTCDNFQLENNVFFVTTKKMNKKEKVPKEKKKKENKKTPDTSKMRGAASGRGGGDMDKMSRRPKRQIKGDSAQKQQEMQKLKFHQK
jgi:hypothetical protein